MAAAASEAGVSIVTGDTKVVQRGKADGCFINTAGVGIVRANWPLGQTQLQPGDKVLLSGHVGDHGIAIMLAREALEIETDIQSDTAPLHSLVAALLEAAGDGVHCLKDPTRGGVATSLNEMALGSEVSIALDEQAIPVHAEVRGACEILGLDPLTIANEGKLLAIVAPEKAEQALAAMRQHPLGVRPPSSAPSRPNRRHGLLAHRHWRYARAGYAGWRSVAAHLLALSLAHYPVCYSVAPMLFMEWNRYIN